MSRVGLKRTGGRLINALKVVKGKPNPLDRGIGQEVIGHLGTERRHGSHLVQHLRLPCPRQVLAVPLVEVCQDRLGQLEALGHFAIRLSDSRVALCHPAILSKPRGAHAIPGLGMVLVKATHPKGFLGIVADVGANRHELNDQPQARLPHKAIKEAHEVEAKGLDAVVSHHRAAEKKGLQPLCNQFHVGRKPRGPLGKLAPHRDFVLQPLLAVGIQQPQTNALVRVAILLQQSVLDGTAHVANVVKEGARHSTPPRPLGRAVLEAQVAKRLARVLLKRLLGGRLVLPRAGQDALLGRHQVKPRPGTQVFNRPGHRQAKLARTREKFEVGGEKGGRLCNQHTRSVKKGALLGKLGGRFGLAKHVMLVLQIPKVVDAVHDVGKALIVARLDHVLGLGDHLRVAGAHWRNVVKDGRAFPAVKGLCRGVNRRKVDPRHERAAVGEDLRRCDAQCIVLRLHMRQDEHDHVHTLFVQQALVIHG